MLCGDKASLPEYFKSRLSGYKIAHADPPDTRLRNSLAKFFNVLLNVLAIRNGYYLVYEITNDNISISIAAADRLRQG